MFGSSRFPEAHPPCPGLRRWSPAGGFQGGAKVPPTYRSQGRGRPRRRPAGVPDPNSSCGGPPGSAGARIPSSQGPGVRGLMRHAHGSGTPSRTRRFRHAFHGDPLSPGPGAARPPAFASAAAAGKPGSRGITLSGQEGEVWTCTLRRRTKYVSRPQRHTLPRVGSGHCLASGLAGLR